MSKSKLGWILLSGASIAAMGAMSPAMAQESDVSEEIVVTATGRAAAIQDVPVAVTAVTSEQMENSGVQDLRDITQLAPSFAMGTGQSIAATTARIRGIGTGGDNVGFEAAVGIFIDGVYRARAGAALADLPELERVEVLRGPQGTLFGRNTSAGALSVVTRAPDSEIGMHIEALVGADDLQETGIKAGANIPITDSFAVSFDGSARARDGYITDIISGDDINTRNRWTARAQALWDISNDASLRVIVDGSESDEVCCGITPIIYGTSQNIVSAISGNIIGATGTPIINFDQRLMSVTPDLPGLPAGVNFVNAGGSGLGVTGLLSFPAQPAGPARNYGDATSDFGISAQLDWDIGGVALTSITAYRDWDQTRNQDIDFHSADVAYRYGDQVGVENFTQEVRLNGEWGRVNWLAGVFYSDETTNNTSNIQTGAHSNLFVNLASLGGTAGVALPGGTFPAGCELFDSTSGDSDLVGDARKSLFYCATGIAGLANLYLAGNTAGQGQQGDRWETSTESWSAFTHNEISLSDNMTLTLGARYTQEDKSVDANLFSTSNSCVSLQTIESLTDAAVPGPGGIVAALQVNPSLNALMNLACNPAVNPISNGLWAGSTSENEWSGTASLSYHVTDDVMLYGGYSRGYKAGGFNMDRQGFTVTPATTSAAGLSIYQTAFDPEFTDAYEIGLKSTILGGTTTLNLAGFYQQIHDYQLNAYNGFNFITRNVPELISQGVELEVASRPIDNLTLTGGVTWNDAYYDSTVAFNPLTLAANCPIGSLGCNADPNSVVSGTPLAFAPEWSVTGAVSYTAHFGNAMQALFYLDGRWNSEYRTQTLGRDPLGRTDNAAYAVFNGRISLGPESEHWSVDLWAQNLTDERYFVGTFQPPLQNSYVAYPNEPLTYGVTVRARY